MKSNTSLTLLAWIIATFALSSCGKSSEVDETYTVTLVLPAEDGGSHIETRSITRSEQDALKSVKKNSTGAMDFRGKQRDIGGINSVAHPITVSGWPCPTDYMWLYSQQNLTGNMICFKQQGIADLARYCSRQGATGCERLWNTSVQSYWPGSESGSMFSFARCDGTCTNWDAWGPPYNVNCSVFGRFIELETWGRSCWLYDGNYRFIHEAPYNEDYDWTDQLNGIASDGAYWYITQQEWIWKAPLAGEDLDQDLGSFPNKGIPHEWWMAGKGYDHLGDLDQYGGYLYIPLEDNSREHTPAVGFMRASDLTPLSYAILPRAPGNGEIPWVAINPKNGLLYTSAFTISPANPYLPIQVFRRSFVGNQLVLTWVDDIIINQTINRVQGGAFSPSGKLYLVSDDRNTSNGGIYAIDVNLRYVMARIPVMYNPGNLGDELQGITIMDLAGKGSPYLGQIHMLMIDIDLGKDDVYFKHFGISDISKL